MATYQYSLFPYHLAISLNPAVHSIAFDSGVSAADFFVGDNEEDHSALLVNGDRLLFIDIGTQQSSFWSGMFQFQDGSMVLVGDNSPGRFDDDLAQTITGGAGNDILIGLGGNDVLNGGDGDDFFYLFSSPINFSLQGGGLGNETINGGTGFDLIDTSDVGSDAGISANFVTGQIVFTNEEYFGGTLTHTITVSNVEPFVGNNQNDTITGGNEDNAFDGEDGHDALTGGGGNDNLIGGMGNDTLVGGAGNDTLRGGPGGDTSDGGGGNDLYVNVRPNDIVNDSGGTDTFVSGENNFNQLPAGIENLQLVGSGNRRGTGNSL